MEVLILTVFVSLVLSGTAVLFFIWNIGRRNHDHFDRLSLLPLDERFERRARLRNKRKAHTP